MGKQKKVIEARFGTDIDHRDAYPAKKKETKTYKSLCGGYFSI